MLKTISLVWFLTLAQAGVAQYFQYSQYNFTSQRINPAMVAGTDYASLNMLYRNQATAGPTNLKSTFLSTSYPIISRSGVRWSGAGISLMDDRAGGIFSTQEAALSYAINVPLTRFETLSLGFKTLYVQKKLNIDGLFTGSQYVPDRGFDESISSGENLEFLKTNFVTFSTGLYWQQVDRTGKRAAYWSVSLFDFNKPEESFFGLDAEISSTFVGCAGIVLYQHDKLAVAPEILFTRSASNNLLNIGTVTSYSLSALPNQLGARIDILTKYTFGRSAIFGLQLHRENFSVGCSYDFPLFKRNVANIQTVEIGIEWRKLVAAKPKKKSPSAKKVSPGRNKLDKSPVDNRLAKKVENGVGKQAIPAKSPGQVKDSVKEARPQKPTLKETLQAKQDSAIASAEAGKIKHQPLTLEKVTLHFNFEFGSSELNDETRQYLDDLQTVLAENAHLKIQLTGHTDNIGSAKFNHRLSLFRAAIVRDYLIAKGVSANRISVDGKGLTEPLNENKTEEERAKNRRVELVILYDY